MSYTIAYLSAAAVL